MDAYYKGKFPEILGRLKYFRRSTQNILLHLHFDKPKSHAYTFSFDIGISIYIERVPMNIAKCQNEIIYASFFIK